jgi:hypothetical protein
MSFVVSTLTPTLWMCARKRLWNVDLEQQDDLGNITSCN